MSVQHEKRKRNTVHRSCDDTVRASSSGINDDVRGHKKPSSQRDDNRPGNQVHNQQNKHAAFFKSNDIDDSGQTNETNELSLRWYSAEPHVPLAAEEGMIKVLLHWGQKERGMLRDQPPFRITKIQKQCKRHNIQMSQACSLRRHHMSLLNPFKSKEALRLGHTKDIREAAAIFEEAIAAFLRRRRISYRSEEEQKAEFYQANPGALLKGTPDFKLVDPVVLKGVSVNVRNNDGRSNRNENGTKQKQTTITSERTIYWIEAKMFYGASTIPPDNRSAVGSILSKMRKYVQMFGEGAIVFKEGCGDQLAEELAKIGVTALSCSDRDIDLSGVKRHQQKWCADKKGRILP